MRRTDRTKDLFDEIEERLLDPIVVFPTDTVSMAVCGLIIWVRRRGGCMGSRPHRCRSFSSRPEARVAGTGPISARPGAKMSSSSRPAGLEPVRHQPLAGAISTWPFFDHFTPSIAVAGPAWCDFDDVR